MVSALMLAAALAQPIVTPRVALVAYAKPCEAGMTTLTADTRQSGIRWKGTKFLGLGSHEGTVALRSGMVCMRDGRITRAMFIADMRSIEVTDIPASDPVPRKRLRDHLLSEDFFHATKYPEAVLFINSVRHESGSLYALGGTLEMRGVTHPISFYARVSEMSPARVRADATIEVDRHRWGVKYRGSALKDDLVDDVFTLRLTLLATGPATASR